MRLKRPERSGANHLLRRAVNSGYSKEIFMSRYLPPMKQDVLDKFISDWSKERPELDTAQLAIFGRITRISLRMRKLFNEWLGLKRLTWQTFDIIATLRRSGPPYALSPSSLYEACLLSSGAMTNRIDRVEQLGLVIREPDSMDRRSVQVVLTTKGKRLADTAADIHFRACKRILDKAFSASEQRQLADLLRKLVLLFDEREQPFGGDPSEVIPRRPRDVSARKRR